MARHNKMITLSPNHYAQAQSMRNFSGWIARKLEGEDEGPQATMKSWAQLLYKIGEHYGYESTEYIAFFELRAMLTKVDG